MKISLKGVGILPDLGLTCDGLTVLTGSDSTGKTTILKSVYCALSPMVTLSAIRSGDLPMPAPDEEDAEFYRRLFEERLRREFGSVRAFRKAGLCGDALVEVTDRKRIRYTVCKDDAITVEGRFPTPFSVVFYDLPVIKRPRGEPVEDCDHRDELGWMVDSRPRSRGMKRIVSETRADIIDRVTEQASNGRIVDGDDGPVFVTEEGHELPLSSVAAGTMVFAVIRILVEKGRLESGSVLLLDEPDAHLHPRLVNILAETISVLVRDLNVRVIMTTHNPQMLMAINGVGARDGLGERYYNLSFDERGHVRMDDVTDDLSPVYRDMSEPIKESNSLYLGE